MTEVSGESSTEPMAVMTTSAMRVRGPGRAASLLVILRLLSALVLAGVVIGATSASGSPAAVGTIASVDVKGDGLAWVGVRPERKPAPVAENVQRTLVLPVWSPDGTQIAWASRVLSASGVHDPSKPPPDDEIWVASADGSGARPLAHDVSPVYQLVWTPQAGLLYNWGYKIVRLSLDGASTLVAPVESVAVAVDATADLLAWGSTDCGRCYGPVVVLRLTSGRRVKIGGSNILNAYATVSPDGSHVAFARYYRDAKTGYYNRPGGIWTASTDGSHLRKLTADGCGPNWSPDGRHIAYLDGNGALRIIAPAGGRSTRLLATGPPCGSPPSYSWSPDSKRIAFLDKSGRHLSVLNVATHKTTPVGGVHFDAIIGFAWSPDSTQLLISARTTMLGCASLWIAPAKGTPLRRLRNCSQ
jgi:Tol biopolymer transport system component